MKPPKTRHEMINEALRVRSEIILARSAADYWNANVRKPEERPVEYDPDGLMRRIQDNIETGLQKELLCIHILGPDEMIAVASLEAADKRVAEFNEWAEKMALENADKEHWPKAEAVVAAWPWDAESHAADLLAQD